MKKKAKKMYMCGVNWEHEICLDNKNLIEVYGSKKALKRDRPCWKECGIVELEATLIKWHEPQNFTKGK